MCFGLAQPIPANKDSKADSSSTSEEKSADTTASQNIANTSFVLRGRKGAAEERLLMEVLIKYGDVKLEIPGEEESDQTAAKYIELDRRRYCAIIGDIQCDFARSGSVADVSRRTFVELFYQSSQR